MGIPPGHTNNPNGRPKGVPNKVTKRIRDIIAPVLENELDNLTDLLNELDSRDRIKCIIGLLPYVAPKMQNIALELNQSEITPIIYIDHNIVENLNNLNPEEKTTYLELKGKIEGKN